MKKKRYKEIPRTQFFRYWKKAAFRFQIVAEAENAVGVIAF